MTNLVDWLLSLSTISGGLISMVLAALGGLSVYAISHRLVARFSTGDLKDPVSSLFRVVGTLVGLMLSLAFAEVVVELRAVENAIEREAVAISDTYLDLQRYGGDQSEVTQDALIDYVRAVIDDDWPALANDELGQRAGDLKVKLEDHAWSLKPETPAQEKLWSRILADIDAISDFRLIRLDNALSEPPIYLYVIVFGFLITMACFGAYKPQPPIVVLAFLYCVFIGLVLYLILAFSDPFRGGIGVEPSTFRHLEQRLPATGQ